MFGRNIAAADLHWRTLDRDTGAHVEAVHDLRVAFRRIDALQPIFLAPLPAEFARGGAGDMRRLMKALPESPDVAAADALVREARRLAAKTSFASSPSPDRKSVV